MKVLVLFLSCLLLSSVAHASDQATPEDLLRWFNNEGDSRTAEVNEGELQFLSLPPGKPVLHSINDLHIDENSIENGWVKLHQCYQHLDAVPSAEVVYRYKQIRHLKLDSFKKIGTARVVGQSVQLKHVGKHAELCVRAEVRIFYQNPDGSFSLMNGPFHRKFLDGYYPYHVTLNIHYPARWLGFLGTKPVSQPGFKVTRKKNLVQIESLFEGILNTETLFRVR